MVHLVMSHDALGLIEVIAARVQISLEPREVAARDLDAEAVPRREKAAGRHGAHRDLIDLPSFHDRPLPKPIPIS
jgi:hypothetical protein